MKRWSKLQKEIYLIIEPTIQFQIHCARYRMKSQFGTTDLPRYWITINKEIIFDYPKEYLNQCMGEDTLKENYPYINEISDISQVIREYIDTPVNVLLEKEFLNDKWGITDILKASDRRIGKRKLNKLLEKTENVSARNIVIQRLKKQ